MATAEEPHHRPWRAALAIAALVLVALGLVVLAVGEAQRTMAQPIGAGPDILIVAPGDSLGRVARDLARAGRIERPWLWRWWARIELGSAGIRAGDYRIAPHSTPATLLQDLHAGRVANYLFTIIEGQTVADVVERLGRAPRIESSADPLSDLAARLGVARDALEGRLFPDTYAYTGPTAAVDLLARATARMDAVLATYWRDRAPGLPLRDPHEALVLASIVEKETGRADERARIARVFINRLQRGMRLQTDPTVIYGMGSSFTGDLRRADLRRDTPWNTYTRHGLPPTPIALPGRAALQAATHPAEGDWLYFVARGDGSSAFSRTLPEHRAAVRRYQLGQGG